MRTYVVINERWSRDPVEATFAELLQQAAEFRPEDPPTLTESFNWHLNRWQVEDSGMFNIYPHVVAVDARWFESEVRS